MSKNDKDKCEVVVIISPEKARYFGLDVKGAEKDIDTAFEIDWKTEQRPFVDLGNCYAYNPEPTTFNKLREQFYAAGIEDAPRILMMLCRLARDAGMTVPVVAEWAENQANRWLKERRWASMN